MTLNAILRAAGISLSKALPHNNTIKSHILVIPVKNLLKLFPKEKVGQLGHQRNDKARITTSKASHIFELKNRPDTQGEFRAVWFSGVLNILDGNHRIRAWLDHEHLRMSSVMLKIYEPDTVQQLEALYSSIDSRKNAKGSQDDLWSIFNVAGFSENLDSEEMKVGKKLATVMKHFLPGRGISERGAVAKKKKRALMLADDIFMALKNLPYTGVNRRISEVFGSAELLAVLMLAQSYVDTKQTAALAKLGQVMLTELPQHITYVLDGSRGRQRQTLGRVYEAYEEVARVQGHKRTGEKVVVARAAILRPKLEAYVATLVKKEQRMSAAA